MTTLPIQRSRIPRRDLFDLLTENSAEVTDVSAGSRPLTHRLTVSDRATGRPLFIAVTADRDESVPAVEHEGRLVVELRRGRYGAAALVAPRHVDVVQHGGRLVVLLSPSPADVMSAHGRRLRSRDVAAVVEWLSALWAGGRVEAGDCELGAAAYDVLLARYAAAGTPDAVLERVALARERLSAVQVRRTTAHGSLCPSKVAVQRDRVVGVDDWAWGSVSGEPLRDLAGFAVACVDLRLDLLLTGRGPLPGALRGGVRRGLQALGLDPRLMADVLVLAVAEHAASTVDEQRHAGLSALQSYLASTKE